MADGHFPDVELLRRELAVLILEWAGKSVKEDPDGPLSTALTRAVSESARAAVAEQHQVLASDAADRIAEALEQRARAKSLWGVPHWGLALMAIIAGALLGVGYLLGLQAGRTQDTLPPSPTASAAPIAPIAPDADGAARTAAPPVVAAPEPSPRPQRSSPPAAKPASRSPTRDLGRPAPAHDEAAPRSSQPVGAAPAPPAVQATGQTATPKP